MPTRLAMCAVLVLTLSTFAADPTKTLDAPSNDVRLKKALDLNGYFPFTPPTSKEEWATRRQQVHDQLLIANGLWPMPEKTPLNPVIHGLIQRDGYTVEKVYFASMPGHYVSGNLYRPAGKIEGKRPGVLCPHGHWANGRFYDAGEAAGKKQIEIKAEQTIEGARYPLQARCVQLAKMGCVVFFYDMVGYADSQVIPHRVGFTDVEAELRLQSFMGLQTLNTIRAFDFLASLPEVDASRIGVTGASGGGTQTFILGAIDDRPAVAFPAVMVSTAMQGGCICENCSYLRVGTGNIEIAGAFAPKPLAMSGANDWTIDIEKKGLPELKRLYAVVGKESDVNAKCWPEFQHNYNQVAREMMYDWFNIHLFKRNAPVKEEHFVPIPPKELSVWDAEHALPKDALAAPELRKKLTATSDAQIKALESSPMEFQKTILTALGVMTGEHWKSPVVAEGRLKKGGYLGDVKLETLVVGRKGSGEEVPVVVLTPKLWNGTVVLWVHPKGKSSLFDGEKVIPAVQSLLDAKSAVISLDAFQTGELVGNAMAVNPQFAGFTFGYNKPLLAQRIHDIRTTLAFARSFLEVKLLKVIGIGEAGPWTALALALETDKIERSAIDLNGFSFDKITAMSDPMMLPGAVKYGGMPNFLKAANLNNSLVHQEKGDNVAKSVEWLMK